MTQISHRTPPRLLHR